MKVVEQRIASGDGEEGELENVTVEFEYDPLDRRIRKSVGLSEWVDVSWCSQPNVMCTELCDQSAAGNTRR